MKIEKILLTNRNYHWLPFMENEKELLSTRNSTFSCPRMETQCKYLISNRNYIFNCQFMNK